ncbi:MAG TPA: hypothetical protein VJA18_00640 [Candidatus Nanoarchaeia archaeon]|nr:hypothetical protein [Candidatus Nanoarchaeia archaeon]
MGLELMLGFNNKKDSSYGVQLGIKNESSYPHHVLQMGLYNDVPAGEDFKGLQAGIISLVGQNFSGAQIGVLNGVDSGAVYGLQVGVVNAADISGAQVGVLNITTQIYGLQIGGANLSLKFDKDPGSVRGAQVGVWNYARDLDGGQAGLFNYVKEEINGLQLGALNIAGDDFNGVQIGLICYAKDGNYLQLGVLTFRGGDRKWYNKFSPFIGFSANGKKEEAEPPKEPQGSTKHGTDL